MSTENERRSRRRILLGGLLALAILLVVCLWWHGRQIPADITRSASQALTAAGFDAGYLQAVDGRVVILSGEIEGDTARQRLVEAVESAAGVRRVIDNLIAIKADSPSSDAVEVIVPLRPARLQYRIVEDLVVLKGELPDQQSVDQLVSAAAAIYGQQKVKNEMSVSAQVNQPDWLSGFQQLLPALQELVAADITIADDSLTLSGVVTSDSERMAIEKRAAALLDQLRLNNQIVVKPPEANQPAPSGQIQLPVLYFKHASTELTADSKPRLAKFIDTLMRQPDLRVEVAAHTDSSGEEVLNTDLSERRTQSIMQLLVSGGVDPSRLVAQSYGESRPAAENTSPEGRALNRRVEFKIIE